MMNYSMKTFAFLVTVLSIAPFVSVSAQDLAVTHRGDTLRGKIKIFNFGGDRRVQVIAADRKKTVLPVFQVKSVILDNEVFQPVRGASGYEFMKLIKEGYLSLYAFQLPNQSTYDGIMLTKRDGSSMEVPNLNFRKAMKKFLEECPGTTAKIDDGTFGRKDLTVIVDHYNECVTRNSAPAVAKNEKAAPAPTTPAQQPEAEADVTPWTALEDRVKALGDFDGRTDALDMIAEIKAKVARGEKVPNFLAEGLKGALKDKGIDEELNAALSGLR